MENITKQHPHPLSKGEQVWRLPSGRTFVVLCIKDDVSSKQGNECFRLMATQLDAHGQPMIRKDGKMARDEDGHYVSHMSHNPDANLRQALTDAIATYLGTMDRASEAHADLDDLSDWIVGHEEAPYLPKNATHLLPDVRDTQGRKIN